VTREGVKGEARQCLRTTITAAGGGTRQAQNSGWGEGVDREAAGERPEGVPTIFNRGCGSFGGSAANARGGGQRPGVDRGKS